MNANFETSDIPGYNSIQYLVLMVVMTALEPLGITSLRFPADRKLYIYYGASHIVFLYDWSKENNRVLCYGKLLITGFLSRDERGLVIRGKGRRGTEH